LVHDLDTTREGLSRLAEAVRVTQSFGTGGEAAAEPLAKRRKSA